MPFGLVGPKGVEPAVFLPLHDAFKKASESSKAQALLRKYDILSRYATGEDFRTSMEGIGRSMKLVIEELGRARKE